MSEEWIIERTLQAARDRHLSRELSATIDRLNRLEAQVQLLARIVEGKARAHRQFAGRTRPVVVTNDTRQ